MTAEAALSVTMEKAMTSWRIPRSATFAPGRRRPLGNQPSTRWSDPTAHASALR
ncbi:hypothetical protein [Microtetraspora fusca]|uniref:Uncharacterized protein n=1 Tax=Microtetraspora fusca TaxID=1997 RepID=A0ABW6VJS9_MICFU|nr:hypothetical protein [Microtetraspora fusca]